MKRRQFLTTAAAGASAFILPGCGGGSGNATTAPLASSDAPASSTPPNSANGNSSGSSGPIAAPNPPADPNPTPSPAPPSSGSASFSLGIGTARTLAPFTLGMPLKQGEYPSNLSIGCDLPEFQAVVKNRWPDGSAKFAILSGRATLSPGNTVVVNLRSTSATTAGPVLTEADLLATGVTASISYGSYGTVQLGSLIGVAARTRTWISGPQMSSWLYSAPIGSDPHLKAWFEVRLWKGGNVEVLPWIENSTLRVANPGTKSGTATFTLNGSQRYSGSITLVHHTRAVLASGTTLTHWASSAPGVVVRHDTSYFQATKLVPAYRAKLSSSSELLIQKSYTPLARGDFPTDMGSAGYDASIGLLPEWDVAYLASSADPRARNNVIVNAYAAGRYGIHYRDETTNRPLKFSSYPNLVINDANSGVPSSGASINNQYTPAPSGSPPNWATSHHPSIGYLAYLITGHAYFMETVQFSATLGYLKQNDTSREFSKGLLLTQVGANTTRGAAWSLRTLFQATSATPDDDPLRAEFIASVEANIDYYYGRRVHPQGFCEPYSSYNGSNPPFTHAAWMEDFLTAAWGYGLDIASGISSAQRTKMSDFFAWKARSIVGRLGGTSSNEFNYRHAAQYTIAIAPNAPENTSWSGAGGPWYASWGQIQQVTTGTGNEGITGGLLDAYFPDPTSYWGDLQPAISYAVDHNVPGALTAYQRMTSASNWSQIVTGFNTQPVWSVRPRSI
ncbi:MAG TPA: hypothetical protein VFS42_07065 [Burkholderiaceae bacterium]|nr:hypothetical protein [Burkholderiaceae bacterium]